MLEVAVNGATSRAEHPRVPLTAREVLADARACAAEGASVV
ncbi:MAG: 3-keto-5-aminohexanoate cleavage protein, partial [Thermodesulfobacteriota bacterium]